MVQYFKGDEKELKFDAAGAAVTEPLSDEKSEFFDGAYGCFVLGELLWDDNLSPLARAIPRAIFREAFASIFESFRVAGTFESYLDVFRQIFGPDVEVTFTVPAAGKLEIDIVATGIELFDALTRYIEDNQYVLDELIDDEGDNIAFQSIKGFESQAELEKMLFEMVPDGIWTQISLTVGE